MAKESQITPADLTVDEKLDILIVAFEEASERDDALEAKVDEIIEKLANFDLPTGEGFGVSRYDS